MIPKQACVLAIVLGILAPTLADPPKKLPSKELKAIEGKWTVVKFIHSDRETTPDEVTVEFKAGTINFAQAAAGEVVELEPTTDPKCLDFKIKTGSGALKEGAAYESIYKLDGDTLTWAVYLGKGKNRPAGFEKHDGVLIMVLKRVKG
jgi:uncharacterized protein (TIGR03067 family)